MHLILYSNFINHIKQIILHISMQFVIKLIDRSTLQNKLYYKTININDHVK
jgi:hypothetical protein